MRSQLEWTDQDFDMDSVFDIWNFRTGSKTHGGKSRMRLSELTIEDFKIKEEPDRLSASERRWVQVEKGLDNDLSPYVEKEGLKAEMSKWIFPYHFIDFETSGRGLYPSTKAVDHMSKWLFSFRIIFVMLMVASYTSPNTFVPSLVSFRTFIL